MGEGLLVAPTLRTEEPSPLPPALVPLLPLLLTRLRGEGLTTTASATTSHVNGMSSSSSLTSTTLPLREEPGGCGSSIRAARSMRTEGGTAPPTSSRERGRPLLSESGPVLLGLGLLLPWPPWEGNVCGGGVRWSGWKWLGEMEWVSS